MIPELPPEYLKRMQALLGEEYPQFLDIYTQPAASGLRVNTLKTSPADFLQAALFPLRELPWSAEGFWLAAEPPLQPGKHPYHAAGLYYLQDLSAMAVVALLDPQPGEKVLDLSAAPGGKATHIASRLRNQGLLVANEMHPRRAWDLAENLERWGVRNAAIFNEEPRRLADHFGAFFDRVLVDAPCSGEGMFRKSQAARHDWSPALVQSCALRQGSILDQAARLVRPGGVLVYSTCTFAPEENEAVISQFLERHPEGGPLAFEISQVPRLSGFAPGRPAWAKWSSHGSLLPQPALERAVRLWPHQGAPEGHFVAVLQRRDEGAAARLKPFQPRAPAADREAFQRFCQDTLSEAVAAEIAPRLHRAGSYLYAIPSLLPTLGDLRLIHPGWWLGYSKPKRFEPAHALALASLPGEISRQAILSLGDPQLNAYLRGESLNLAGEEGWVLIAVQGFGEKPAFPLGWGKRSGNMIKNGYPRGLRWN